jgi:hypothetical protein
MPKLPAKAAPFVLPLILTFMMTLVVSGVSTWRAIGGDAGWLWVWGRSWMVSWAVAYPIMVLVLPVAQRLMGLFVEPPRKG